MGGSLLRLGVHSFLQIIESDSKDGDQAGGIRVLSDSLLPKHLIGRIDGAPIQPDLVGVYEVIKVMLELALWGSCVPSVPDTLDPVCQHGILCPWV